MNPGMILAAKTQNSQQHSYCSMMVVVIFTCYLFHKLIRYTLCLQLEGNEYKIIIKSHRTAGTACVGPLI